MSKDEKAPRGEEGWKAAKAAIEKRNEAAYERGSRERAARDAAVEKRRADAERREAERLPRQPARKPPSSN